MRLACRRTPDTAGAGKSGVLPISKMNVHIFCNNDTADFPPDNGWEKFPPHLEEIRLFNFAARSWERQGWAVHRLETKSLPQSSRLKFSDTGNGPAKAAWYPSEFWQYLAAVREVMRADPLGAHVFTSLDVQNLSYPAHIRPFYAEDPIFQNYQQGHFSLSTFRCNLAWVEAACCFLEDYDAGAISPVAHPYVSDEMVLREYFTNNDCVVMSDLQAFPPAVASLIHHSRSSLRENFNRYPVSSHAFKSQT